MEEASVLFLLIASILLLVHIVRLLMNSFAAKTPSSSSIYGPKCHPIVGSGISFLANAHRLPQYFTDLIRESPTHTIQFRRLFVPISIVTANPANVEHMLKTKFHNYPKGPNSHSVLYDLLGNGIFNADGETWKVQRKVASHEFNTRSLRKFVETAVKSEISGRLIPLFTSAAAGKTVLDLQDVLQRFAFDNICKVAFGSDPSCLDLNLPPSEFTSAFNLAVRISSERFRVSSPLVWKIKAALGVGTERQLRDAIRVVDDYARNLICERRQNPVTSPEDSDLLSRFMSSSDGDEEFLKDMIISFLLAGMDTTSAALTWFFWLVSNHKRVEEEVLKEISSIKAEAFGFDEAKEMHYLHAAICESMRLYPPVPTDGKFAAEDDVLPDGTVVPKGAKVIYAPYAMGRLELFWGKDWEEFRPERWLQEEGEGGNRRFVNEDPYKYPVFQAGPRVCLGKEMAFIQMKCIAATVLRDFRVVPAVPDFQPVFASTLTSKMKGGFPVRIVQRKP
ncbi:cytochrome P450 94A2-like [Nymphaea colorata]|nr:cytochrome P450 94A2-like [Nymphaea colorata]